MTGRFVTYELSSILEFDGVGELAVDHDHNNHLPIALARIFFQHDDVCLAGVHDEGNSNLIPTQKLLLRWHERFVHKSMYMVQKSFRVFPFLIEAFKTSHRQSTKGSIQSIYPETDGTIHDGHLRAENLISVNHFESRLKGRTYEYLGGIASDKYVGGCIFVDSMSSFLHVEHQFGFSGSETIRAKQNF